MSAGSAALAGQAAAERMMLEPITFKRPTGTGSDDRGAPITTYAAEPVYDGKCRIRQRAAAPAEEIGGAETLTTTRLEIHVPVSAGDVFLPGDVGFVGDQPMYRVLEGHDQTFQTAIRLPVERVR